MIIVKIKIKKDCKDRTRYSCKYNNRKIKKSKNQKNQKKIKKSRKIILNNTRKNLKTQKENQKCLSYLRSLKVFTCLTSAVCTTHSTTQKTFTIFL